MSYPRRGFANSANSSLSVGQRRAGPVRNQQSGNFQSAAPNSNMTNKPMVQTPHQQHQQGGVQHQPPHQQQEQKLQTPVRQVPVQQTTPQQQPSQLKPLQQQFIPANQQANTPQQPQFGLKREGGEPIEVDNANTNGNETETGDGTSPAKKKPFWMKTGATRINKRERSRRRNERLRRLLQPKNAVMVLNELVGGTTYNVSEIADMYEGSLFKCTIVLDGQEHSGVGKSKPAAKGAAAEVALKHLVLTKFKTGEPPQVSEPSQITNDEKMDTSSDEAEGGISWSHVASYALHKLLNDWDGGASIAEKLSLVNPTSSPAKPKIGEKKPAKKLPATAATMNPIMLLNQMHPNAVYEDVGKSGNPPHVHFTVQCTVEGNVFQGSASNKKAARKLCAFGACIKVLGIQYEKSFLDEHGIAFDAAGNVVYATKPEQVS